MEYEIGKYNAITKIPQEMKSRQELKRASIIAKSETVDSVDGRGEDKPFGNILLR